MSPRVAKREQRAGRRSSWAEFRSRGNGTQVVVADPAAAWWKYMVAPPIESHDPGFAGMDAAKVLFEESELRVLSKATFAAGGYLVPQDFDEMVSSARRARGVIGELARPIETDHGRPLPLPTTTA